MNLNFNSLNLRFGLVWFVLLFFSDKMPLPNPENATLLVQFELNVPGKDDEINYPDPVCLNGKYERKFKCY